MERLTFKNGDYVWCVDNDNCFEEQSEHYCGPAIDRLAHYEDLEEQGRLVVLPCKIDAPIYLIHQEAKQPRKPPAFRVDEYHIDHFTIGGAMIPMITACSGDNEWEELIDGTQCGQEYFLTREEAETALEKGAQHETT